MSSSLKYRITISLPVLAGIMLSACASSGDGRQIPSYASMVDGDTYRVICLEASSRDIYVRYNATDSFYNEDGSEKTREDFCNENTVGTRTR